jgi:DNA-directed RNA polymerase subunit beta'
MVMNRNAEITLLDDQGWTGSAFPYLTERNSVNDGQGRDPGTMIADWDAFSIPLSAEVGGKVKYGDVVEGDYHAGTVDHVLPERPARLSPWSSPSRCQPAHHHQG